MSTSNQPDMKAAAGRESQVLNGGDSVDCLVRYNHSRWESIGDLMVDLMRDMTPRPFWIEFGRYATRVTDENKDALAHGLHLALEFQMARDDEANIQMRNSHPTKTQDHE